MRIRALLLSILAAAALSATPVLSQTADVPPAQASQNPFSERGGTLPPVMRWLQGQDVKLTYLGDEGGIKGYLGEASNGRHQVFYPTPDGEHMLAGIMFRSGGQNVTSVQIAGMLDRFADAAREVEGADVSSLVEVPEEALVIEGLDQPIMDWFREAGHKVTSVEGDEGGLEGFVVETAPLADGTKGKMQFFYVLPDDRYAIAGILTRRGGVNVTGLQVAAFQQKYQLTEATAGNNASEVIPGPNPPSVPPAIAVPERPAPVVAPGPAEQPASAAPAPILDDTPISDLAPDAAESFVDASIGASDFLNQVNTNSVFFTVGRADLPALYMVADPQCPFCHQAWAELRPLVFGGKLQVRVIMIAGLQGSDPLARSILSQPDPSAVWLAGQGSMSGVRIDAPPAVGSREWDSAGRHLMLNHAFIDRFGVNRTPFLAYVKDDRVYASRGVPEDFSQFLAALN